MGDVAEGRFVILAGYSAEGVVSALSYQMNATGNWALLANVSYDSNVWRTMDSDLPRISQVGQVVPMQDVRKGRADSMLQ